MTKIITSIIIIVVIAGLISWDVFVLVEPTEGDTISEIILGWAYRHPFIPASLGVLMGHLMWPIKAPRDQKNSNSIGLMIYGIVFLLTDILINMFIGQPKMIPLMLFVPHFFIGHFFWGQDKPK